MVVLSHCEPRSNHFSVVSGLCRQVKQDRVIAAHLLLEEFQVVGDGFGFLNLSFIVASDL